MKFSIDSHAPAETLRSRFCVGYLLGILCFVTPAQAEDFTAELADFDLQELLEVDLVYGASKFEQKTAEAPASISIIRSAEIKQMGYQTLADALSSVRGFYSTFDRHYHYSGARGFGRPGDYNTRLLVLVDGHRVNDNLYSAAPVGNDFVLDLEMVDRIEVIRGPGSSLYGTSAMFGVINVVTKTAEQVDAVSVAGTVGSFGARNGAFQFGKALKSDVDIVLSGSFYRSDGQTLFFEEFNKVESNDGLAEQNDDEAYEKLFGKLNWNNLDLQFRYSSREKTVPTAPWGTVFNHPGNGTDETHIQADLTHKQELGTKWHLQTSLGFHQIVGDEAYVYDYSEDSTPDLSVWQENFDGIVWLGAAQFGGVLSDQSRLTAGLELGLSSRENQSNSDEEATYLDSRGSSTDWGVYGEYEFKPAQEVILNLGARYDHHENFGGTTNPRAALIYNPRDGRAIKLLYGQAFRAPNAYELSYHDGGFTSKASGMLGPETIQTWEVVWEEYLGRNLFLTVGGFRYEIRDLISQTTDPEDELLLFVNVDAADADGLEFELKRQWTAGPTGRVSYGYQETKDGRTGEALSNAPKHLARLGFSLPVRDPSLVAGLEFSYSGGRRTLGGAETSSAFLTNLTVTKSRLFDRLDVSASVYNLFDVLYEHPGFEEHSQDTIEQDGRQLRLKTSYSF